MTAVKTPPAASARGLRPAIQRATATIVSAVSSRTRKPTVPAAPGSRRRYREGPRLRPADRASARPRTRSAATVATRTSVSRPGNSSDCREKSTSTPAVRAPKSSTPHWARCASWRSTSEPSPACRQTWVRDSKGVRRPLNVGLLISVRMLARRASAQCVGHRSARACRATPRAPAAAGAARLTGQSAERAPAHGRPFAPEKPCAPQPYSSTQRTTTSATCEAAERLVRDAAADGAELVVLPEKWTLLGPPEALRAAAEPLDGPALGAAASWARELGIHLVAGSVAGAGRGPGQASSTRRS